MSLSEEAEDAILQDRRRSKGMLTERLEQTVKSVLTVLIAQALEKEG